MAFRNLPSAAAGTLVCSPVCWQCVPVLGSQRQRWLCQAGCGGWLGGQWGALQSFGVAGELVPGRCSVSCLPPSLIARSGSRYW